MADGTQNKTEILAIILPQLGNPADARMLVSKALDGNSLTHSLTHSLTRSLTYSLR